MLAACIRATVAAGTALLLAGCAVATVETVPAPVSGPLNVAAPAQSRPSPSKSRWLSECFPYRFQGKPFCALSIPFEDARGSVTGTLTSLDGGRNWLILSGPRTTGFQLRVDQHPALKARCNSRVSYCRVPKTSGDLTLTEQLRDGRGIALQVLTAQGELNQDLPNVGFPDALQEVRVLIGLERPNHVVEHGAAR